ncbi:hypothetical protein [Roseivirga sp.]|uniref:hypothetical protein n=1 Tax=Roseivirga sp. TaxID=1964215 RepID=UPI003B8BD402
MRRTKANTGLTHYVRSKWIKELFKNYSSRQEVHVWFKQEQGSRMGVYNPGGGGVRIKGSSSELLGFRVLLSISYSAALNRSTLSIYPSTLGSVKEVKSFTINEGFLLIREWLQLSRPETWFEGNRYFQVGLNESLSQYSIFEIHNNRIIKKDVVPIKIPITD